MGSTCPSDNWNNHIWIIPIIRMIFCPWCIEPRNGRSCCAWSSLITHSVQEVGPSYLDGRDTWSHDLFCISKAPYCIVWGYTHQINNPLPCNSKNSFTISRKTSAGFCQRHRQNIIAVSSVTRLHICIITFQDICENIRNNLIFCEKIHNDPILCTANIQHIKCLPLNNNSLVTFDIENKVQQFE